MSDEKKNRKSMFIILTGVIISVGRIALDKICIDPINQKYILLIMAVLNYIAMGFVIYILYTGMQRKCQEKLTNSGISTGEKKQCKGIISTVSAILLIVYLILGIIYIWCLRSSGLNDVLAILALAISIANDDLINEYGILFYQMILKINALRRKIIKKVT